MTLAQALASVRSVLSSQNIPDAGLEGEVIVRYALGIDRTRLYLNLNDELSPAQEKKIKELMERRLSGVPLAYITGHREFYGLDFYVNRNVLIPRPETELLVEKAIDITKSNPVHTVADIGTGSGVIAVTLAAKLPDVKIYAVDISEKALEVARSNAEKHGVANLIDFIQGDLVEPLPEPCDLIAANLPYVSEEEIIQPIASEPHTALSGGKEGLDVIKRFCREVKSKLKPEGFVLMEIGQGQSRTVKDFLLGLYPNAEITIYRDLAEIDRVIQAKLD